MIIRILILTASAFLSFSTSAFADSATDQPSQNPSSLGTWADKEAFNACLQTKKVESQKELFLEISRQKQLEASCQTGLMSPQSCQTLLHLGQRLINVKVETARLHGLEWPEYIALADCCPQVKGARPSSCSSLVQ